MRAWAVVWSPRSAVALGSRCRRGYGSGRLCRAVRLVSSLRFRAVPSALSPRLRLGSSLALAAHVVWAFVSPWCGRSSLRAWRRSLAFATASDRLSLRFRGGPFVFAFFVRVWAYSVAAWVVLACLLGCRVVAAATARSSVALLIVCRAFVFAVSSRPSSAATALAGLASSWAPFVRSLAWLLVATHDRVVAAAATYRVLRVWERIPRLAVVRGVDFPRDVGRSPPL